ncbi:GNAT family N-acetyltransferase [Actinoplanes sp. NPDC051851]|uniref:GNAT family N-acetyltransferase n=1 Tax=Actinoplanes sp. NPDC051851 TaxID=3154753 RepID=UPI003420B2DE
MSLLLRPWADTDATDLAAALTDPDVLSWTRLPAATEETALAWIATQHANRAAGTRYSFAVIRDGHAIANVALKLPAAEVAYWTAAPARGQGVASRALAKLTTWAFTRFGMESLALLHRAGNEASCGVARRAGYPLVSDPDGHHRHVRERPR